MLGMHVLGMLRCWVILLHVVCWAHPVEVDYVPKCVLHMLGIRVLGMLAILGILLRMVVRVY
ncbi:hypothetical protein L211DRAFT_843500 [Terfezia boudieri ATCC MYA-4762]|uniref:Uncharacterized protein n=1 Tax=Terfezia boudieri ATCC MYA-4762 TaxID=1051890 RepID=A0A3N4L6V3_9PEZI|nr:hypothetical protein L211DRAFT_843500 [Terfezia boudieri ATCC MYA-4762]